MLSRAFSRDEELEADAFAAALVTIAGGDALAGERLLGKLAPMTAGRSIGAGGACFATHPALEERLANLRQQDHT